MSSQTFDAFCVIFPFNLKLQHQIQINVELRTKPSSITIVMINWDIIQKNFYIRAKDDLSSSDRKNILSSDARKNAAMGEPIYDL